MPIKSFFIYLAVMAITTYLIRMIPFVIFDHKIENKRVKAFFDYIPYTVLSAMTFPSVLYSTGSIWSAAAGCLVALILAFRNRSLLVVAIGACLGTLAIEAGLMFLPLG